MDFKELLGVVGRIQESIEGADSVKAMMRTRMTDYGSVLQAFQGSTPAAFKHELERLQELFAEIEQLHAKHTANSEDGRVAKVAKIVNRGTQYKSIGEALDAIDQDVVRQFSAIAAKSSINTDEIRTLLANMRPPTLPDMAAVPLGALTLPPSYVERSGFERVVDDLMCTKEALTPYTVVGMGGQGKTVLASAVVRSTRVRGHFQGGIFWVKVGRGGKNSLGSLLQNLARDISAAPTDAPHGVPHAFNSLEQVTQHLAVVAFAGTPPRLVVLDDVWDSEVVDAFLPLQLKILVTTRDRLVVGVPGGRLELGNMAEDEAVELLAKTSSTAGQLPIYIRARMTKVVALCGFLPLALAIAGSMSVVKGKGLTVDAWEDLIKLFENVSKMMRARGEQETSLNMVLGASFDVLSVRKQEEMMKMAVMAPGVVASIEMLLNLWEIQDVEGTRDEAKGLANKCLLQDVSGGGYRVHDLLLDFVKIKIKAEMDLATRAVERQSQYLRRLDVVMGFRNPEYGVGSQGFYFLAALWRSVEELSGDPTLETVSYRVSLSAVDSGEPNEDVATWYFFVGNLFELQGKHFEAEPLYERSQAIREQILGPEDTLVANVLNDRAALLGTQGKYAEAEPLYERSQAIQEKVLGPESGAVADILNNRAVLKQEQGKYTEAELLHERSMAIHEKLFGPEDTVVANDLHNRGNLCCRQGKYAEAGPLFERSQTIKEKALGPEHPDVARVLNSRAGLLKSQGKLAEAGQLYERSQAIYEKVHGAEHPNVAMALANRAMLLENQGMYAAAEPLFQRSQSIHENVFGPEHPDVAFVLNSRAQLLQKQGKYAEAEPLFQKSLAIREKVLGPEHPDVASGLDNVAEFLGAQGKFAEAELLFERSQVIREQVLGPDHPDMADVLHNRAVVLKEQGKYTEAELLYERAQIIGEKALGPEHPDVATMLNNRAFALTKQGKYAEAEPLYERSRAIQEKVLGPEHPGLASVLNNQAALFMFQGKITEAERNFERSQALIEKALGLENPEVAGVLHNRALLLAAQGKHAEAEPLYERSEAIQETLLITEHPLFARGLEHRADSLIWQGKYAKAEPLYERLQAIRENMLDPQHPDVADVTSRRAVLFQMQGMYKEAVQLWTRSFSIRFLTLGENHGETVICRKNLENALIQVKDSW